MKAKILILTFVTALLGIYLWNPQGPVLMQAQAGPVRLTSTTISAAQTAVQTFVALATATGVSQSDGNIAPPSTTQGAFIVYVDREEQRVTAISGTTATVQRGWGGTAATSHANAARVWFGLEGNFQSSDPPWGSCVSPVKVVPWINVLSGNVWICKSSLWQASNVMNITYNSTTSQTSLSP